MSSEADSNEDARKLDDVVFAFYLESNWTRKLSHERRQQYNNRWLRRIGFKNEEHLSNCIDWDDYYAK